MDAGGAGPSRWSGGFSLELGKQEIEADFLAMTGRKPPRRHKRRPKSVQRQINVRKQKTPPPATTANPPKIPRSPSRIPLPVMLTDQFVVSSSPADALPRHVASGGEPRSVQGERGKHEKINL
jgi:hypothetical protein